MISRRTLILGAAALWLMVAASGCMRRHLAPKASSAPRAAAMPKGNFNRPAERLGQFGLDGRSREIESSLGVEN